jgi:tRNA dimethylallyltransferase
MASTPLQAVAVCGPTASGKTALGISLAYYLNGEIVNVDSVQVYTGADIGSAKATMAERRGVPHHLLDLVAPDQTMNAGEYREHAIASLKDISARGKVPVLVGGSGMYLTILLHGIAEVPATPPDVRAAVMSLSREEQYDELTLVDPATAARLHVNDTQRVSRALEIFRVTGKKPSEFFEAHKFGDRDVAALLIVICRERDELYERINRRSRVMVDSGLIAETRALLERYGKVPVLETIGYKQACEYLEGTIPLERVAEEIALHTRRFAKRQMTFLRNEPAKRGWSVSPSGDEPGREIVGFTTESKRALAETKGFRAMEVTEAELVARVQERLRTPLERTEVWYVVGAGIG